ncbi:hypothetical protein JRQ81_008811 [Phrynocephalus forsythii]|uniref:Paralemmin-1 n=1 Tax=Phrynocephalus forsythii TaxID=171643 RepID=A0A9Q0XB80_9SAUR|nr:hypothetical protein JRQ81_008811 [Phrynocephalus forsythii]
MSTERLPHKPGFHGGLKNQCSETDVELGQLRKKLEAESARRAQLESANAELQAELSSARRLHKSYDDLQKSKLQLEEEIAGLRHQVQRHAFDLDQAERSKRDAEDRAKQEVKQKLEEVNLFLQTQAASQEALEQIRAASHASLRHQMETRIRDLESELGKLQRSQQEVDWLKESAHSKLERANEMLAESNARLLQERSRSGSVLAGSFWGGSLSADPAPETLSFGHLGGGGLAFSRPLGLAGGLVDPAGRPRASKRRVEAYVAKMQKKMEQAIKMELDKAREEMDAASAHISMIGSVGGSSTLLNPNPDPVSKAYQEYLETDKGGLRLHMEASFRQHGPSRWMDVFARHGSGPFGASSFPGVFSDLKALFCSHWWQTCGVNGLIDTGTIQQERLQAIAEKRKRQTEIENKRRQLEDDRRHLQHLKALRERWLLEGTQSSNAEEAEAMKKQMEEDDAKAKELEVSVQRLESELEQLENGISASSTQEKMAEEAQVAAQEENVPHTPKVRSPRICGKIANSPMKTAEGGGGMMKAVVHAVRAEDGALENGLHQLSSSEVDELIHKADEVTLSEASEWAKEAEQGSRSQQATPRKEITGLQAKPNVEDEDETKKVLGLEGTIKAELVVIEEAENKPGADATGKEHGPPNGTAAVEPVTDVPQKAPESLPGEQPSANDTEPKGGEPEPGTKKQRCKCCSVM